MEWDKSLETGIAVVDAQHRQLFALCTDLDQAFQQGVSSTKVEEVLKTLRYYTVRHFTMEEKYMRDSGYPGLKEQQDSHQAFIKRLEEMYTVFKESGAGTDLVDRLKNETDQWLMNHVLGLDKQFSIFWKERSS